MKRARWDPVYPFTEERLIPLPPFIRAGTGLESEGLILSLKFTDPITINAGGFLTIKVGEGVQINDEGELTSSAAVQVDPPLEKTPESIKLNTDSSLSVDSSNKLTVIINNPLEKTLNGISLKLSSCFNVDENGNLMLINPESPLSINQEGKLSLQLGQPLAIIDNLLTLKTERPLAVTAGALNIKLADPFVELNGNLEIQYNDSLKIEDGKLAVKTTGPIQTTEQGLKINVGYPFSTSNSTLSLKLAPPLMINTAGELTLTSKQGSQIVSFMNFFIALGWQIIPSNVRFIYILTCSQFLPTTNVSTIEFQADTGLASVFVVDSPFYATVTQQLANNTIKTYGVTITKNAQNTVSITFSSPLESDIVVSAWTASMTRLS